MLIPLRPPLRKGGLGGFDIENIALLILQFALIFDRRREIVHEVY